MVKDALDNPERSDASQVTRRALLAAACSGSGGSCVRGIDALQRLA